MTRRRQLLLLLAFLPAISASPALAEGEKKEKKKGGGDNYLQLPTLTASLNMANGRRGVLTVEVGLDVKDAALRTRATGLQPRLRDAYNRFLLSYAASISPGAPPNLDYISQGLQRSTDQVLGKPGAKLLLGTVLEN